MANQISTARSLLFVPASRPERFARACTSGADLVCLDLEDATPPDQKEAAREAVAAFLKTGGAKAARVGVRINSLASMWGAADLSVTRAAAFVMVPKAEDTLALEQVRASAPHVPLWALVETPEGLRKCWEIAVAPGVAGLVFGAFDYSADVGCELAWEPLLFARSQLAAACARARVQLMDAPSADIADDDGLVASTRRVKALGFTARACIHPGQVASVNTVFTPTAAELAQARRVVVAFEAAAGAAVQLDGKMVDLPVVLAARRILAAGAHANRNDQQD